MILNRRTYAISRQSVTPRDPRAYYRRFARAYVLYRDRGHKGSQRAELPANSRPTVPPSARRAMGHEGFRRSWPAVRGPLCSGFRIRGASQDPHGYWPPVALPTALPTETVAP